MQLENLKRLYSCHNFKMAIPPPSRLGVVQFIDLAASLRFHCIEIVTSIAEPILSPSAVLIGEHEPKTEEVTDGLTIRHSSGESTPASEPGSVSRCKSVRDIDVRTKDQRVTFQ